MPFKWSGVASAPDGRHGLLISPVTGLRKGGLRTALFLCRPCPLSASGVASAPGGRHGLLIGPVTGIKKGRSSDRPFLCRACGIDGRRRTLSTLSQEMPHEINRLHNSEGRKRKGSCIVPFWNRPDFIRLFLQPHAIMGHIQERITAPYGADFHSDRLISALFSCAFSHVSRF